MSCFLLNATPKFLDTSVSRNLYVKLGVLDKFPTVNNGALRFDTTPKQCDKSNDPQVNDNCATQADGEHFITQNDSDCAVQGCKFNPAQAYCNTTHKLVGNIPSTFYPMTGSTFLWS